MKFFFPLLLLLTSKSFADLELAPPNLKLERGSEGVFVDITKADHHIVYDTSLSKTEVMSTLTFNMSTLGQPIFDLVIRPKAVYLNDEEVKLENLKIAQSTSQVRILSKTLNPGTYQLKATYQLKKFVTYAKSKRQRRPVVRSAFWMSDLSDRRFLEQFLIANLEYDHYPSTLTVKINGTNHEHSLKTNAHVTELAFNHFKLETPAYFTASSLYFHLYPEGAFKEVNFSFKSLRETIPITIYGAINLSKAKKMIPIILKELEQDYGPWPHPGLIVYLKPGSGGMEYAGATATSMRALGHELFHSYFARGVMPARGNAGWIDEALARWRDDGYKQSKQSQLSRSNLANHSIYQRKTDRHSYARGSKVMGHLDKLSSPQGGLRPFLKNWFEENKFRSITTQNFKSSFQDHFAIDLDKLFAIYVYGNKTGKLTETLRPNPYHMVWDEEELYRLL